MQQVAIQQQEQQALVPAQSPQHIQQVAVASSGRCTQKMVFIKFRFF